MRDIENPDHGHSVRRIETQPNIIDNYLILPHLLNITTTKEDGQIRNLLILQKRFDLNVPSALLSGTRKIHMKQKIKIK